MGLLGILALVAVIIVIIIAVVLAMSASSKKEDGEKSSGEMSQEEKDSYKKEKQEREWADPNEHAKYVCHGGKVQCKYCNVPISEIIVTSTTVMLQDKPWATIKDNDGLVNFNFTGQCMHPSQQKPLCPPPPCKAVINLGEWKDFSKTIIHPNHALVVQATIPCMISGEDLEIVDSGQKATPEKVEPEQMRKLKIKDVYWKEEDSEEKYYIDYPDYPVTLYIETTDYIEGDKATIKIKTEEGEKIAGKKKELKVSGKVNAEGIAIIENFKFN